MQRIDQQAPVSEQVYDFAQRRGRTRAGAPDLDGLVLVQGPLTYLVHHRTVVHETAVLRPTGKRNWRPVRIGATLDLSRLGSRDEWHHVATEVAVIDLDVLDSEGGYFSRTSYDGSHAGTASDGVAEFALFLDSHAPLSVQEARERSRQSSGLPQPFYAIPWGANNTLPRGLITHIGWLYESGGDDADATPRPLDPNIDDGGLSAAREATTGETDLRAAQAARRASRHAAALADRLNAHHALIDDAVRAQDARCAKAVGAFLAASKDIEAPSGHIVWSVSGHMHSGEDAASFHDAVVVRPNGQVALDGGTRGARAGAAAHHSFQPHVTVRRSGADRRYDRGADAAPGQLPFYVFDAGGGADVTVRHLTTFQDVEVDQIPELIAATTDWFVRQLARYLDERAR